MPAHLLLLAFAALIPLATVVMLRRVRRARDERPGSDPACSSAVTLRPPRCDCQRVAQVVTAATIVELLTGFFGVGGGFILLPALVLALGCSMPTTVGTSLVALLTAMTSRRWELA